MWTRVYKYILLPPKWCIPLSFFYKNLVPQYSTQSQGAHVPPHEHVSDLHREQDFPPRCRNDGRAMCHMREHSHTVLVDSHIWTALNKDRQAHRLSLQSVRHIFLLLCSGDFIFQLVLSLQLPWLNHDSSASSLVLATCLSLSPNCIFSILSKFHFKKKIYICNSH